MFDIWNNYSLSDDYLYNAFCFVISEGYLNDMLPEPGYSMHRDQDAKEGKEPIRIE